MKAKFPILFVVAALLGSVALRGEDAKPDTTPKAPAAAATATGSDPAKQELARKRREEAEKLTPEQREARRKEATEKREARIKALQAKQKAGTLNENETRQLERLEAQNARFKKAAENAANGKAKDATKSDIKSDAK